MTHKASEFDKIRPLVDLASEDVISWTDDEVRERAAEQGVDIKANADGFRAAVSKFMEDSRLARLKKARAALDADQSMAREETPSYQMSFDEMRVRLNEIIASGLMAKDSRLSLAGREAKDIDESDLRSLLEDYEDLKARQHPKEKDQS